MLKTGYKKFIIALLLLAFTSQTMATAAMTCQLEKATQAVAMDMSSDDHMAMDHTDHASMDHSQHANSLTDTHQKSDCCKTMGHCLLGGCSLATATTSIDFLLTQLDSAAEDFYSDVVPTPLASSLYRPPIFR
jgi:uncharacterized protein involved in copper resistance